MRIPSSNRSRRVSSAREEVSSGRGGDGDMGSMGCASGSIASRIGERANRRGCLRLQQENQDQGPNREERNDDDVQHEMGDVTDQDLFERGPALMPEVPREEDKVVLTPLGDRQWREDFVGKHARSPNGIIGLLIRRNYPGFVDYNGNRVAAHKFCHYHVVPEPTAHSREQPTSALQKIETKFWYYFKWADGKEAEARRVVHNIVKCLIPSAFYEARLQSIIACRRHVLKVNITRNEASKLYPSVEEYMKAIPYWFATCPDAWKKLAELWNTDEWKTKSRDGRIRKAKKLRIHRQGSASAARYQKNLEKKLKRPVFEIEAYLTARTEKGQAYADTDAHDSVMAYAAACEEIHGPEFAWDTEPIDGVAAYKARHGKKHGRYLVGDGMISTPTVLSEVRLSHTASESLDEHLPRQRLRPNSEDAQAIEHQLQAEMERRLQQQREEMEQKLQKEREEMDHKLHQEREEMEQKRHQDREAWEAEMLPEQDYYKNSLLAITQHLQMDLPPPPRPLPRCAQRPCTSELIAAQAEDALCRETGSSIPAHEDSAPADHN